MGWWHWGIWYNGRGWLIIVDRKKRLKKIANKNLIRGRYKRDRDCPTCYLTTSIFVVRFTMTNSPFPEVVKIRKDFMRIEFAGVTVWYSFIAPVAFRVKDGPLIVRENEWGPKTGLHLNALDKGDKKSRLPRAEFMRRFDNIILHPRTP